MRNFFEKNEKIFNLANLERDVLLYRVMPRFVLEIIRKYFRLRVEGAENLPRKGRALIIPNHSGYAGFDAIMLGNEIRNHAKRIPRILAHPLWFINKTTAIPLEKMGITEATMNNGASPLEQKQCGHPFSGGRVWELQTHEEKISPSRVQTRIRPHGSFTKSPIVPTVVIGAEETHITLSQLKFTKYLIGTVLPLPLNVLPLPAQWKIKFLKPIYLDYPPSAAEDRDLVYKISRQVKDLIQFHIDQELRKRSYIYVR